MPKRKYITPEKRQQIRSEFIGKRAWYKMGPLEINVEIVDACSGPSKTDLKIIPLWGFGSKWVDNEKLNFSEAVLNDESGLNRVGNMRKP